MSSNKYVVKQTGIEDLQLISPTAEEFSRNFLVDLDSEESQEEYRAMGIEDCFVHSRVERLARGVMRGLHFQPNVPQSKFVAVTSGRIYAVAVDLRPGKEYGAAFAVELTAESGRMIYVPAYFAFGYLTLEPQTEVVINSSVEHTPEQDAGIIYDDQILSIDWQFDRWEIDQKYLNMTQRDKRHPAFRNYNPNTMWSVRPDKKKRR
ncbi:MAG: dTDP-4-dehydrorhamnose 3,5-epimerase [Rikenellaceae bacterium]